MSTSAEIRLLRKDKGEVMAHLCGECSALLNTEELLNGRCPDYGHELVWTEKDMETKFRFSD